MFELYVVFKATLFVGLARGYFAKGDYKTALKHLNKALINEPNPASKGRVQSNIDKLKKVEDIN